MLYIKKEWIAKIYLGLLLASVLLLLLLNYRFCCIATDVLDQTSMNDYMSTQGNLNNSGILKSLYSLSSTDDYLSNRLPGLTNIGKNILETTGVRDRITVLAKAVYNARKHARGSKTSDYLSAAISVLNDILRDMNIEPEALYKRQNKMPTNVCSETFKGPNVSFPLYHNEVVTKNCKNAVPIHKLITIITYINLDTDNSHFTSLRDIKHFITAVNNTYNNVRIMIALDSLSYYSKLKSDYPGVYISNTKRVDEGSALNNLIEHVETPYVFVARTAMDLTNDSRLERLISEIESVDVVAAGGSTRDQDGHWRRGCFQTVYRNFTLSYIEGYDESFHNCLFCDYIQGPFVTKTTYLKQNKLEVFIDGGGLYEDWFLRIFQKGHETIVCPDSMLNVHTASKQNLNWRNFLLKWNLRIIFTPSGYAFSLKCIGHRISKQATKALSPCDLRFISKALKLAMRTCEETGIMCELEAGTVLGAVKLGKVLPWEKDFDIRYLATNCTMYERFERALRKAGFAFRNLAQLSCTEKLELPKRINFKIYYNRYMSKVYMGDMFGVHEMDSDQLTKADIAPTKVIFDGQWLNAPRNPGLFLNNMYGKEIYRHVDDRSFKSRGGFRYEAIKYEANAFLPCKYPGRQECLDRYNGDGDLQFSYLLP